ncbi:hypothetical protein GQ43DRAFT_430850 [Delitschia confertaspora ATCC 74209]|uniref:Uncharacterized protein n=1 Tax=Delitschia confertaspora ATCC 74209 TaxID=1513339 RepID=A0A9P4JN43_9PLEO|nr:hypothetical protein GQ43DRAFT_430850 [Delitschia confertaspora ATCC 74209]
MSFPFNFFSSPRKTAHNSTVNKSASRTKAAPTRPTPPLRISGSSKSLATLGMSTPDAPPPSKLYHLSCPNCHHIREVRIALTATSPTSGAFADAEVCERCFKLFEASEKEARRRSGLISFPSLLEEDEEQVVRMTSSIVGSSGSVVVGSLKGMLGFWGKKRRISGASDGSEETVKSKASIESLGSQWSHGARARALERGRSMESLKVVRGYWA